MEVAAVENGKEVCVFFFHMCTGISKDMFLGDGCIRHIKARIPVNCSIVSQRRVFSPFGLEGGGDGARGRNLWIRHDPEDGSVTEINLGNNGMVKLGKGDSVRIETPGGGGWGSC